MNDIDILILISAILFIILWLFLANMMAKIGVEKGYSYWPCWHTCFWLGVVGFIIIAARQDKTLLEAVKQQNIMLEKLMNQSEKNAFASAAPGSSAVPVREKLVLPKL